MAKLAYVLLAIILHIPNEFIIKIPLWLEILVILVAKNVIKNKSLKLFT